MEEDSNNNREIVGVVLEDLEFGGSRLINNIMRRFDAGHEKYGHGVNVNHDTTRYGTLSNDWVEMAQQECLDCLIYLAASEVRRGRRSRAGDSSVREKLCDIRKKLIEILDDMASVLEPGAPRHRPGRPPPEAVSPSVFEDIISRIEELESWQQNSVQHM